MATCIALAAACTSGSESSGTADSGGGADVPLPPPANGPALDTVGGANRLTWTLADLEMRLRTKGIEAVRAGTITQPFMGPIGVVYRMQGAQLQAYIYADAVAVGRDTDKLDTARVSPPTMMISWVMPPSLITENNLAVILLTRDPALRERVRLAITADPTTHDEGRR